MVGVFKGIGSVCDHLGEMLYAVREVLVYVHVDHVWRSHP